MKRIVSLLALVIALTAAGHPGYDSAHAATYGKQIGSGSGSSATPVPDQTIQGNVSGGAALPGPMTIAQVLTMLGVTPLNDVRAAVLIRAQALAGNTLNVLNGSEFDKPGDFVSNPSGSGIGVISTTLGGGVLRVGTTAAANSGGKVSLGGIFALGAQITNLKTGPWYFYARVKMATGFSVGSFDLSLTAASGGSSLLTVGANAAISTTNWGIITFDHAGNHIISNAALTQTIDQNWHDVEMVNDNTNIDIYIDAVKNKEFATSTITAGDPVYMQAACSNSTSAVNLEWNIERMYTVTPSN